MFKKIIFFSFFFLVFQNIFGQIYDFKVLNQKNGLPSSAILSIFQDSRNLLWIGTDGAGLVRYDGKKHTIIRETEGTMITDIIEDTNHNILTATRHNGLLVFNGRKIFKEFNPKNSKITGSHVQKLMATPKGIVCFTENEIFLVHKNYSITILTRYKEKNLLINAVFQDDFSTFLIGTDTGILKIKDNEISPFRSDLFKDYTTIVTNGKNKAYIGTRNGELYTTHSLDGLTFDTKLVTRITLPNKSPFFIRKMLVTKDGVLWMAGNKKQGLIKYTKNNLVFINEKNGFTGENPFCLLFDNSDALYVGTYGSGLHKSSSQSFINYNNKNELKTPYIFALLATSEGLYVGIQNSGILHYQWAKNQELILKKRYPFSADIFCFHKNEKNEILAGTDKGIFKLTPDNLISSSISSKISKGLFINYIKQDNLNRYFVGTSNGLYIFDKNFTKLSWIPAATNNSVIEFTTLEKINDSQWYAGTNNGLFLITSKPDNRFSIAKTLLTKPILNSCKDSFGNYWFSTSGSLYSLHDNTLKKYSAQEGLSSGQIFTLSSNQNGNIFSGNNLGIDKITVTPKGGIASVLKYDSENGFDGLETNSGAQTADDKGNFFFGTANGLIKYIPKFNTSKEDKPILKITEISINNKPTSWESNENKEDLWFNVPKKGHQFDTNENQLTFTFNCINYKNEAQAYYSYYLEGLDTNWSEPSKIGEITYSNLDYGKFNFQVRVVDKQGNVLSSTTSFPFQINTPFYYKWWFLLPLFCLIGLFIKLLVDRASTYNKEFIKNYSETEDNNKDIRIFFFFLGIVFPLTEVLNLYFIKRPILEILISISIGILFISLYIFSHKSKVINTYLRTIFIGVLILYSCHVIIKIATQPFDLISYTEFLLIVFFSYSAFNKQNHYLLFVLILFTALLVLLFNIPSEKKQIITLINTSFIILIINYARRISILNNQDKILFSNSIINNSNSLTIATDRKGNLSFCGKSIEKILGYKPEEVLGENFWKLTQDEDFKDIDYNLIYIPDSIYTRKLRCKNGEYKYIQWTDKKYNDNLFVANGQDITAKINIEEQYRNLVQYASDIIFEVDKYGYFTFVNNFAEKSLGYPLDFFIGNHFSKLVKPEHAKMIENHYFKNTEKNDDFDIIEFPIIKKNGEEMWVSQKVNIKKDETGKRIGYSAIVRDITKLKKLELEENLRVEKSYKLNQTLNKLSTLNFLQFETQEKLIRHIIKEAALTLNINRASLWNKSENGLELFQLYIKETDSFSTGIYLNKKDFPVYFHAIENEPFIVASNANTNPLTVEFQHVYFKDYEIKSLLDFPIYVSGEFKGVTCYENTNEIKNWSPDEINFARTVSDIIALAIETLKRRTAEELIIYKSEILSSITQTTEKLLKSNNLDDVFEDAMSYIGKATKVDRLYYFENDSNTNMLTRRFEWVSSQKFKEIRNPNLQVITLNSHPKFKETLLEKKPYQAIVTSIEDTDWQKILHDQHIKSFLIIPLFIKNTLQGFIGFDDCLEERIWTTDEIKILQTFSNNFAATIERINSEKAIKESEEKFRLLANNIPATVYLVKYNEEKTKLFLNDEIEKLTGYSKKEFFENKISLSDLYHPEEKDKVRKKIDSAIAKGKPFHISCRLIQKNGDIVWIEEYGEAIKIENEISYIEGVVIETTERRKMQEAIKEKEIAQAANKAKTQFLANMSHEIRTPLNGIIGFTNLMLKSNLTAVQEQYMTIVNQSADALLEIVNDVLDLSKIEAGKLELYITKSDLHEIINQVIDMVKFSAHEKKLDLIININEKIPSLIWVDEIRLKQILVNLLSNAIKFTPVGEIELEIQHQALEGNLSKMKFLVKDTGIGIRPENKEKIFQVFSQEDNSTTRKYGGTGLGIPISERLLHLMNSKLNIEDRPTGGTIFYFELEIKAKSSDSLKKLKNNTVKTILLIDDNDKNMGVITRMMNHFGITTLSNKNYQNAYKYAPEIDMFIADYELIGKEGLSELSKYKKPIVIMQNSNISEIEFPKNTEIKPIVKPVKIQVIQQALNQINQKHSSTIKDVLKNETKKTALQENYKVLIVEDNKINMLLSKTLIQKIIPNAILIEALNGVEAIEQFDIHHPEIILMDIQMPLMNGYEATEKIREKDKKCIIIALTAGIIEGEKELCKKIGMNDYITKPVDKKTLEDSILKLSKKLKK